MPHYTRVEIVPPGFPVYCPVANSFREVLEGLAWISEEVLYCTEADSLKLNREE